MYILEKHTSSSQSQMRQVLIVIEELIHAFRRSQASLSFEGPSTIKITFTGPNSDRSAVGKIEELLKSSTEINLPLTYLVYHRENLISHIVI